MSTVAELKEKAKNLGLKYYSKLNKAELIDLIEDSKKKRKTAKPSDTVAFKPSYTNLVNWRKPQEFKKINDFLS